MKTEQQPDPVHVKDARRIKAHLKRGLAVEMQCFSRVDMEGIQALLTPEEIRQVRWRWYVLGRRGPR